MKKGIVKTAGLAVVTASLLSSCSYNESYTESFDTASINGGAVSEKSVAAGRKGEMVADSINNNAESMQSDSLGAVQSFVGTEAQVSNNQNSNNQSNSPETEPAEQPAEQVEPEESNEDNNDNSELLTAGRWTDNDNWEFFTNIVNADRIKYPSFGLNPINRVEITAKDSSGNEAVNAEIVLLDKNNNEVWRARTDNKGKAYLMADKPGDYKLRINDNDTEEIKIENKNLGEGSTKVANVSKEIVVDNQGYGKRKIMFLMDTTGSMTDERGDVHADFAKIVKEIADADTKDTEYCFGFYKDTGDIYDVKVGEFSSDYKEVVKELMQETAIGGTGEPPELVERALDKAITNNDNWDTGDLNLLFLIYDAPPHSTQEAEELVTKAIKSAASKGIKIIPVFGSVLGGAGSSGEYGKQAESFGRAASIMTGGTYVFLTDDSGIGESHEEPLIGDYEVKSLHDYIVEIINEYSE